jgi:hypothetical protein
MKAIFCAAVAACALASTAAYAGPFDAAYGNTVTQTGPDGTKVVIYVNADGTWQRMMGGQTASGTYAWKDATTACFTQTNPAPTPEMQARMGDGCQKFNESHGVGETWTEKAPNGATYTVSITAGRS